MKIVIDIPDNEFDNVVNAFAQLTHYNPTTVSINEKGESVVTPNELTIQDNLVVALLNYCELVTNDYHRSQMIIPQSRLTHNKTKGRL